MTTLYCYFDVHQHSSENGFKRQGCGDFIVITSVIFAQVVRDNSPCTYLPVLCPHTDRERSLYRRFYEF